MSLEQDMLVGDNARRLMEDETFKSVIDHLQSDLMQQIAQTGAAETSKREALYFEHRGLSSVLTRLKALADNGTYARHQREKP